MVLKGKNIIVTSHEEMASVDKSWAPLAAGGAKMKAYSLLACGEIERALKEFDKAIKYYKMSKDYFWASYTANDAAEAARKGRMREKALDYYVKAAFFDKKSGLETKLDLDVFMERVKRAERFAKKIPKTAEVTELLRKLKDIGSLKR